MPYQVIDHDTLVARGGEGGPDEVLATALGAMEDEGQTLVAVVPAPEGSRYVFHSDGGSRRVSNMR